MKSKRDGFNVMSRQNVDPPALACLCLFMRKKVKIATFFPLEACNFCKVNDIF